MKERLRAIDAEYGFNLTEEEMDRILKEAKEAEALLQQIQRIDLSGKAPFMKLAVKGTKG
jgi:hypothetical protein